MLGTVPGRPPRAAGGNRPCALGSVLPLGDGSWEAAEGGRGEPSLNGGPRLQPKSIVPLAHQLSRLNLTRSPTPFFGGRTAPRAGRPTGSMHTSSHPSGMARIPAIFRPIPRSSVR